MGNGVPWDQERNAVFPSRGEYSLSVPLSVLRKG
jgi:hypothetical protein